MCESEPFSGNQGDSDEDYFITAIRFYRPCHLSYHQMTRNDFNH